VTTNNGTGQPLPPGIALAWGATLPSRRGPKPTHSIDDIVDATMRLADEQGFAALTMPRIAERLGFTANALYRYVRSKDELLVLLADAGWGPAPEALRSGESWRSAAAAWVHGVVDRYAAHPWLLDIPVRGAPLTPNLLTWQETLMSSVAGFGLTAQETLGCTLLLDGYARNAARLSRDLASGSSQPAQSVVAEFLLPLLEERGLPMMATLISSGSYLEGIPDIDAQFGLDRILDGIDALIARHNA